MIAASPGAVSQPYSEALPLASRCRARGVVKFDEEHAAPCSMFRNLEQVGDAGEGRIGREALSGIACYAGRQIWLRSRGRRGGSSVIRPVALSTNQRITLTSQRHDD